LSDNFIAINDEQKRLQWVFMCGKEGGKESLLMERQRERECVRGRASEEREIV
jgi:hypothetical protein